MSGLHLLRLPVKTRSFVEWAWAGGYLETPPGDGRGKPRDADLGYALHALTTGLFGREAPRPFHPPPLGQRERRPHDSHDPRDAPLYIWGYARRAADELSEVARLANDELSATVDWSGFRSKRMPAMWPEGIRLRFELRACPVKRRLAKRPLTTRRCGPMQSVVFDDDRKREMDAYQLAAARAAEDCRPAPTRTDVYIQWLAERFARSSGNEARPVAALVRNGERDRYSVRVESWRSTRLLRRPLRGDGGSRQSCWLTRPDVRFSGVLRVVDPEGFPRMLASGVGRHCGFGFGMLLLKPA